MKAEVQKSDLLDLISKLKPLATSRTLPIIQHVLLKSEKGKLVGMATDLESYLVVSCKGQATGKGVCVPPKALEDFLKAVEGKVKLTGKTTVEKYTVKEWQRNENGVDGNIVDVEKTRSTLTLKVEVDGTSATFDALPAEDFPPVPKVKGKAAQVKGLAHALEQVRYAQAKESTRPVLQGVKLKAKGRGKADAVAADGYRMAISQFKAGKIDVILPPSATKLLTKLKVDKAEVRQSAEAISFAVNGFVLVVKPIEGAYPTYKQLIPKGGKRLTVGVAELVKAVKLVQAIKPDNGIVRLETTKGKYLLVSSKDASGRQVATRIPVKGKGRIAFNGNYLLDLLKVAGGETITLQIKSPSDPCLVKQSGTVHVLMPMFVQW